MSTANTQVADVNLKAGSYNASKETNSLMNKNSSYKGGSIDILDGHSKLRRSMGNDGMFLSHLI